MELRSVETISIDEIWSVGTFDLVVHGCGFESRSPHFARVFAEKGGVAKIQTVLAFDEGRTLLSAAENEEVFRDLGLVLTRMAGVDQDVTIFNLFASACKDLSKPVRIIIDISVMTRSWYGAMLTWLRTNDALCSAEVYFVYSLANYTADFEPLQISDVISIPGFEGRSSGAASNVAVFLLGFDRLSTLAVLDRLEPDILLSGIALNGSDDPNSVRVMAENRIIIDASLRTFHMPLLDVESSFRILCDQVFHLSKVHNVVLVPMGPKTHILAALLCSLRTPSITCLHARGARINPTDAVPNGVYSVTRALFSGRPPNPLGD